jgi:hypothetical protein
LKLSNEYLSNVFPRGTFLGFTIFPRMCHLGQRMWGEQMDFGCYIGVLQIIHAQKKVTVTQGLLFCRQSLKSWRKTIQFHTCQATPAVLVLPYQRPATARVMTTPPAQCPLITRPTSTRQRKSGMTYSISSNRELASPEQTAWMLMISHHHLQESG